MDPSTVVSSNWNGNTFDVEVKHENSSTSDLASAPIFPFASPSNKRTRSSSPDSAEKRQRIEPGAPSELIRSDDFTSILQSVSLSVTQQFQQSAQGQVNQVQQHDQAPVAVQNCHGATTAAHTHGFTSDPYLSMRILSLPVLDSLSTQILSTLARGPYPETIQIVTDPESELGQAYAALKSLFDDTKKIYSQPGHGQFLSADELGINEASYRATIRTTNVATFAANIFGGYGIDFYALNDHFIGIFTPEGEVLGSEAGKLYINLKTQMYLSSLQGEEQDQSKEQVLEDLFSQRIAAQNLETRRGAKQISNSETEFLEGCRTRQEYFLKEPSDAESIQRMSEEFSWEGFLRDLSDYLNKAYGPIIDPYMKRHALTAPASPIRGLNRNSTQEPFGTPLATSSRTLNGNAQPGHAAQNNNFTQQQQNGASSQQYHTPHALAQNGNYQYHYTKDIIPYPTQSAPTKVLYEKARQAAVAKSHPGTTRRPGLPSQRRPWSTEEENTLMTGLDQVKGPHWSQILALYGPNGSVNDVLKDRNQVQLKDKARNLKLFFLKSSIEVPYYLQSVTGELKTRAPTQAARKEAEDRAKFASAEERARMESIGILATGFQNQPTPNQHRESSTSDVSRGPSQESLSPDEQFHVTEQDHQTAYQQISPQGLGDGHVRQTLMADTAAAGEPLNQGVQQHSMNQVAI